MSSHPAVPATRSDVTPAQCRGARGLLDWRQADLAEAAQVALGSIRSFENGTRTPYAHTIAALKACFEAAGIVFVAEADGTTGVLLRPRQGGGTTAE